jgi:hypothetical protein
LWHNLIKTLYFLGEYSCLQVDLMFARQLSFFVVTIYVPCSMTVTVSWFSFWLDHKAVSSYMSLIGQNFIHIVYGWFMTILESFGLQCSMAVTIY